jgi:hypothetical protein
MNNFKLQGLQCTWHCVGLALQQRMDHLHRPQDPPGGSAAASPGTQLFPLWTQFLGYRFFLRVKCTEKITLLGDIVTLNVPGNINLAL